MSEFHVEVVRIGEIIKHPNADTLSITNVHGGYPVIIRTGEFKEGDLAVYVPIDSIVPDTPQWAFLDGKRRIKAKKIRGIFSMGMLAPLPNDIGLGGYGAGGWDEGDPCQEEMCIEKYDPIKNNQFKSGLKHGVQEKDPGPISEYTDIEGFRRYKRAFDGCDDVVVTEKIHGTNARFVYLTADNVTKHDAFHDKSNETCTLYSPNEELRNCTCERKDKLWVGSHHTIRKDKNDCSWWIVAKKYDLENKLKNFPNITIYGEIYGNVQDLTYGKPNELCLMLFDAQDVKTRRYLDYDDFVKLARELDIPTVPLLYRGSWNDELTKMAEGKTTVVDADHVREGIVIKPSKEGYAKFGRLILKLVGEGYLLRKGA